MKKLPKYLFFIILPLFFLLPSFVLACDKSEVRIKLGINDELKECRAFIYEATPGYYKQMPREEWRLVKFQEANIEFFKKYCEALGYSYADEILLPQRWVRIDWKFYYAIISIILAITILAFPFIKFKRKDKI